MREKERDDREQAERQATPGDRQTRQTYRACLPEDLGLSEVVERVEVHFEDLVDLAEAVPRAVVPPVDLCNEG